MKPLRFIRLSLVGALLLFWALGIWMGVLLIILDTLPDYMPRGLAVLVAFVAYFVLPLGALWLASILAPDGA